MSLEHFRFITFIKLVNNSFSFSPKVLARFSSVILNSPPSELGLTIINFCFLYFFGSVMLPSSSAIVSTLKFASFLLLHFITVGGSWLPVNQAGTIIHLSSHHVQPLCSKDENVIFWLLKGVALMNSLVSSIILMVIWE